METLIADYLSKLEFGELQSFKNMGAIPLLTSINGIQSISPSRKHWRRNCSTLKR